VNSRSTLLAVALFAVAACSPGTTSGGTPAAPVRAAATPPGVNPNCPKSQPAALPAGQKRVVTISTAKGNIEVTVEGALSPIAAGNFVALASCGFYNGVVFHRLVPGFVIQGGDPTGSGSGGPGYEIQDEPVTAEYHRGTVAMARTRDPNSQGSQFFIVLSDQAAGSLVQANTYAIFGEVTSGMETVDAIAAMPNSGEASGNAALQPVAMDSVTVKEVP
jgi:cyclophilin family peptidyl-prolyl cis-trans isomerase